MRIVHTLLLTVFISFVATTTPHALALEKNDISCVEPSYNGEHNFGSTLITIHGFFKEILKGNQAITFRYASSIQDVDLSIAANAAHLKTEFENTSVISAEQWLLVFSQLGIDSPMTLCTTSLPLFFRVDSDTSTQLAKGLQFGVRVWIIYKTPRFFVPVLYDVLFPTIGSEEGGKVSAIIQRRVKIYERPDVS